MRRRGFTLVELMTALGLFSIVFFGAASLYVAGLRSYYSTSTDADLAQKNAQGIRRVVETLREAVSLSINSDGTQITFQSPKKAGSADPVTGETEYIVPVVGDGVAKTFTVTTGGNLVEGSSGRTLCKNIVTTDPYPQSSQYNQKYMPFQFASVGSSKAVSVNLITYQNLGTRKRYARMKTTVLLRNVQ